MKVLHVTNAVEWSGGMEQMRLLISGLAARGETNFLACPPDSKLIERLAPLKIPVRPIRMLQDYDLIAAWRLRRWVREVRPDVVHSHHAIAHAVALLALAGTRTPALIVSRRVSFPPRRNPFSRWKYGSARINAYSVVSASVRDILVRGGVDPEKIRVIYSAADPKRFAPARDPAAVKAALGIPEKSPVAGKIANFSRWKGQHVFLEAARLCLRKNPGVTFILAGKGTESLAPRAEALGVSGSVRLLGFRDDAAEILSILDVSVNSAIEGEGLSGAVRESLLAGVPVVASDVAGNREVLLGGEAGTLVPPGRADLLAEGILAALADPEKARARSRKGREWVIEHASEERMLRDTLRLYRDASKKL